MHGRYSGAATESAATDTATFLHTHTQGTGLHYEGEFRSGKFAGQGILEYGTLPAGAAELTVLDYQVSAMLKGAAPPVVGAVV